MEASVKEQLLLDEEALVRSIRIVEQASYQGKSVHAVVATLSILKDLQKSIIQVLTDEAMKESSNEEKAS